jgi:hypothetical protein
MVAGPRTSSSATSATIYAAEIFSDQRIETEGIETQKPLLTLQERLKVFQKDREKKKGNCPVAAVAIGWWSVAPCGKTSNAGGSAKVALSRPSHVGGSGWSRANGVGKDSVH